MKTHGAILRRSKSWEICESANCVGLFKTIDDIEKHTEYHCGGENGNPFTNNNEEEGAINRKTMYGRGIPEADMFMFKGKLMFGNTRKRWKCLICEYARSI